MPRVLAALLVATGLSLVTSPAHADVSVTIGASRTAFPAGESTTIRGKAWGAKPGSVLKLQRKVSGSWRTVAKKKVWSTRRYAFRVSPPRGVQRYRVKKAWHRGQPPSVSKMLRLAVLDLTMEADPSTLMEGEPTRLRGKAHGAERGSVVKLQHRVSDTWKTVSKKRVWRTRRYAFEITPPRDYQRYRVVKPWQDGQPRVVSPVRQLTVQWRPDLALGEVEYQVNTTTGQVTVNTSGTVTGMPGGITLERQIYAGEWVTEAEVTTDADGGWQESFAAGNNWRFRYLVRGSGTRLTASSEEFVVDGRWTPTIATSATLDSLSDIATVDGTTTGLPEGATVTRQIFVGDTWRSEGQSAVDADGSFADSFPAKMDREYRYLAPEKNGRQEATSQPFQIPEAPPARVHLSSATEVTFPAYGTTRALVIHLDAGQTFTYHRLGYGTQVITDPTGNAVPGVEQDDVSVTAVAPTSGDYTVTLKRPLDWSTHTVTISLSAPVVIETELDAPSRDVTTSFRAQYVDMTFEAEGGHVISAHTPDAGSTRAGRTTLLDPTGAIVPVWEQIWATGGVWRLPDIAGTYTLRITPYQTADFIDRRQQAILTARTASITVDGDPGHVSFDRPGRLGVLTMSVPAGLDVLLSATDPGFSNYFDRLIAPDGEPLSSSLINAVNPTMAGTYQLLVSGPSAEVDFFATTPAEYDLTVGTTTPFDQGPAPLRKALLKVPVTAGELFSIAAFDESDEFCRSPVGIPWSSELVDWTVWPSRQPSVVKVAQDGDLTADVIPCSTRGTFRTVPTTIAESEITETRDLGDGDFETTSMARFEATKPGQVMIVEYDAGQSSSNQIHVQALDTSFPAGTEVALSQGVVDTNHAEGFAGVPAELLETTYHRLTGRRYLYVWAGPTDTGTLDLELRQLNY